MQKEIYFLWKIKGSSVTIQCKLIFEFFFLLNWSTGAEINVIESTKQLVFLHLQQFVTIYVICFPSMHPLLLFLVSFHFHFDFHFPWDITNENIEEIRAGNAPWKRHRKIADYQLTMEIHVDSVSKANGYSIQQNRGWGESERKDARILLVFYT